MKDYNGEEITGTFYQSELQKIDIKDNELWKIEKILKTKRKGHNNKGNNKITELRTRTIC
jgi:hypothetical protein